jgi:hypothetical protein
MVGRFQVMALLQAAWATALGYPLDEAESFGASTGRSFMRPQKGDLKAVPAANIQASNMF